MIHKTTLLAVMLLASGIYADDSPKVVLESKVDNDGDLLVLSVNVEGIDTLFYLDTNAQCTVLDIALRESLFADGVEFKPADEAAQRTAGLPVEARPIVPPTMTIKGTESGEVRFPTDCAVVVMDISAARTQSKHKVQGVLGMDFLERYALDLDVVAGSLKLIESSRLPALKHDAECKLSFKNRRPYVPVLVGSEPCYAFLGTGSLLTLRLNSATFKRLADAREVTPLDVIGIEAKRPNSGWLKQLRVGPFEIPDLYIQPKDSPSNLLGLDFFRRFHCVFDFPREVAYFDKGKLFEAVDDGDHAGIHLAKYVGLQPEVRYVAKGSAGEKTGIRVGDRLISIDGRDTRTLNLGQLQRALCYRQTRTCEILLSREGKELTVKLPPSQPTR